MQASGNTILVTGASSGIGKALAERWARDGNTVIAVARRVELLQELERKYPGHLTALQADVQTAGERERLTQEAISKFPKLNVLV
jgi:uncharacterized oxidoreductase